MILDEPMEFELSTPVRFSHKGGFYIAKTLVFRPPMPKMAQATFKMNQWFAKLSKEITKFLSESIGPEMLEQVAAERGSTGDKVLAGSDLKAIHEDYSDDDEAKRAERLIDIEEEIAGFSEAVSMSSEIDFFALTNDFGKMVTTYDRCDLKGTGDAGEATESLKWSLWQNDVESKDRVAAAIRYCCFFGLTSSLAK